MTRSMQLPYHAYVTAFLQTDLFLTNFSFVKERQFRSSDAVTSISVSWLVMALLWGSNSEEILSKNKSVYENAVTRL